MWNGFNKLAQMGRNIGNKINSWNNTYRPLEEVETTRDVASTGSNFRDIGLGALGGLAQINNRPQTLYPTFNYAGNGLARSAFVEMGNPYYSNPQDLIKRLAGVFAKRPMARGINNTYGENTGGDFNTSGRLRTYDVLSGGDYPIA